MLFVVPLEKLLAEGTAVLDAAEPIRELRTVLHGAELAFRVRIVVGNIGSAMALGHTQEAIRGHYQSGATLRSAFCELHSIFLRPTRGNSSTKWNLTFGTTRRAVLQLAA